MKIDISKVVSDLHTLADGLETVGASDIMGPHQMLEFITTIGKTKVVIKCQAHPHYIRQRVKRLTNSLNGIRVNGYNIPKKQYTTTKQAKHSKRVAQQFLNDGELDNYKAYEALYD